MIKESDIVHKLAEFTSDDKGGFKNGQPYMIKLVPVEPIHYDLSQEVNVIDENDESHKLHYDSILAVSNDFVILN